MYTPLRLFGQLFKIHSLSDGRTTDLAHFFSAVSVVCVLNIKKKNK